MKASGIKGYGAGYGSMVQPNFGDRVFWNAKDYALARKSWSDFIRLLHIEAMNRGIYLAGRGFFTVSTPMTEKEIDKAGEVFADCLEVLKPYVAEVAPHLLA